MCVSMGPVCRALSMQSSQAAAVGVPSAMYRALSMRSSQEEAFGVHGAHVYSAQHAVLPRGCSGSPWGPCIEHSACSPPRRRQWGPWSRV